MLLFHRTTIAEARVIMKQGFENAKWGFEMQDSRGGQQLKLVGVWLTDRPLSQEEGPDGDAVMEVDLGLAEDALAPYELAGLLEDARLWVLPAELLNRHGETRIGEVDPRTSWWYEVPSED